MGITQSSLINITVAQPRLEKLALSTLIVEFPHVTFRENPRLPPGQKLLTVQVTTKFFQDGSRNPKLPTPKPHRDHGALSSCRSITEHHQLRD